MENHIKNHLSVNRTDMKVCFKCKQGKPLSDFYPHKSMSDGHLNKCKECTKRDVANHRKENIDRIRSYDRLRSSLPHRVSMRITNTACYRAKFPEREKANAAVRRAIRRGAISKLPCFVCGKQDVEAHHPAYSLPLDVVWLCHEHHRQIHLKLAG